MLKTWADFAEYVRGKAFDCGHFLPEQDPAQTAKELMDFLL